MASSQSSRLKLGGILVVLVLASYALYCGVAALITGDLSGTGSRRNNWHHTGLQVQVEGAFLVAVGATILLLPFVDVLRSRLLRVLLVMDMLLFVVAAFLYKLL